MGRLILAIIEVTMLSSILLPSNLMAGRLYGNGSVNYEFIDNHETEAGSDAVTRETLILTFEDALFVKNSLRLSMNLQRREFPFSDYREFRPVYYLNLESFGYDLNLRYSPYTRRVRQTAQTTEIDVKYREWRLTSQLNYPKWPGVSFVYNRLRNFDTEDRSFQDAYNRNFILESNYTLRSLTARGNYSNLQQVSNLSGVQNTTETYSSTLGFQRSFLASGYISTSYNYYDTRRKGALGQSRASSTHSLSSLVSMTPTSGLSMTASYSGRFTDSEQLGVQREDENQNLAARMEYSPWQFVSFYSNKGYQINSRQGDYDIIEYLSVGATLNRYLRKGVDTRINFNRTMYQQSLRLIIIRDTSGNVTGTINAGDYVLDTYTGSMAFDPLPYVTTNIHLTVTHDSQPTDVNRRYQFSRSLDARFYFSRKLEGHLAITSTYQGAKLRLDQALSEQYNAGLTYIPTGTLNINLTYVLSKLNNQVSSSRGSFIGYVSYSFRRSFTIYTSVNQRFDRQEQLMPENNSLVDVTVRPRTINSQLIVYLSRKINLTAGYLYSRSVNLANTVNVRESIQVGITVQI